MDEKERYYYDGLGEDIYDSEIDDYPSNKIICDTLNQQDKHIKELEEENKVGDFWHSAYQGKQLEYDQVCAESRKIYEENQQLKEQLEQNKSLIDEEEHISKKMQEVGFDNIEDLCKTQKQVHTETITVDSGLTVNNSLTISSEMEGNKVYIWGYELCKGSEWKDFLEVANRLGEENKRLKKHIEHIENIKAIEFIDAIKNYEQQIRELKQSQKEFAIRKLEKVKELGFVESYTLDVPNILILKFEDFNQLLNNQIKELKGENNE